MSSLVTLHEPYFQLTDNNGNNQDEVEKPVEGRADTGADGFGLVPKKKKNPCQCLWSFSFRNDVQLQCLERQHGFCFHRSEWINNVKLNCH